MWSVPTNEEARAWPVSISLAARWMVSLLCDDTYPRSAEEKKTQLNNGTSPITLKRKMRLALGLCLSAGAASEETVWFPVRIWSGKIAGCVCAPVIIIIMHPMPVCSISGGDIFDCIQRGNVEQCTHFIQTDRSVLKQKGMVDCYMMEKASFSFSCTYELPATSSLCGSLLPVAFSLWTAQSLLFLCIDFRNYSSILVDYWWLCYNHTASQLLFWSTFHLQICIHVYQFVFK